MAAWTAVEGGALRVYRGSRWGEGRRLAAFDFDGTLREYRKAGPPAELTVKFLAQLSRTWNIVIFTNRSASAAAATGPLEAYVAALEAEGGTCDVYAATGESKYRKPLTGSWDLFRSEAGRPGDVPPGSFYCGDAAGRDGDFAASDRWFAHNIGLRFTVPERIFGARACRSPGPAGGLGVPLPALGAAFARGPAELAAAARPGQWERTLECLEAMCEYDIVVMAGRPGSGKSYLAKWLLGRLGYTLVSLDVHKSAKACTALAAKTLAAPGGRVVVDNTSRAAADRALYIDLARALRPGARTAIISMNTSEALCRHLDRVRYMRGQTPRPLPAIVYRVYASKFEPVADAEADFVARLDFADDGGSLQTDQWFGE